VLGDAWNTHAGEWISWARAPGHDSYWRFHRDAFLPLVPPPGRLTLDLGCGEGRLARDLARLGHRVVGIDGSPAMAAVAAAHPGTAGWVAVGDAAALPVADAAADCVVAFMSLQDIDDMEEAVAQAARVLTPGGRLVIAVTHPANTAGKFAPGPEEVTRPFVIDGPPGSSRVRPGVAHRGVQPAAASAVSGLRLVSTTTQPGLPGSGGRTCAASRALSRTTRIFRPASRLRYSAARASRPAGMHWPEHRKPRGTPAPPHPASWAPGAGPSD